MSIGSRQSSVSTMKPPEIEGSTLIHQFVEKLAKDRPHSVAVLDPSSNCSLTYSELNQRGNQVARKILKFTRRKLELPVALLLQDRSTFLVAALASLKAGCVFVPLSVDYPAGRIHHILTELALAQGPDESHVVGNPHRPILITDQSQFCGNEENFLNFAEIIELNAESFSGEGEEEKTNIRLPTLHSGNLAYIIYTSGTSGVPKGVMVEHGSLVSRLNWLVHRYNISSTDRTTVFLNSAIDASLNESWGILQGGGTLIIVPSDVRTDPEAFVRFVNAQQITRVFLPTVFAARIWTLSQKFKYPSIGVGPALRTMFTGGEQPPEFPFSSLSYQVVNCYGPTEATIQVTAMNLNHEPSPQSRKDVRMSFNEKPSIGYPVTGVKLKIVGNEGNAEDELAEGELWVGGSGLARGYWNNPTLTRDKFLLDSEGQRWYRTGDEVRRCPTTGALTWLRRIDSQIKVNGFLVEPSEVEGIILKTLGDAVALVKVIGIESRLVAFVVLHQPEIINEGVRIKAENPGAGQDKKGGAQLREKLIPHLPHFMLPSFLITLKSLPTTANGKVSLPQLENEYHKYFENCNSEASTGEINSGILQCYEEIVASIWSRVLNIPKSFLTRVSNLLYVGGNSLHVSELASALENKFGVGIPKSVLNGGNTTVGNLSKFVVNKLGNRKENEMIGGLDADHEMGGSLVQLWSPEYNLAKAPMCRNDPARHPIVAVFLPPEMGHLQGYNALVHRLGSYFPFPIYGIDDGELHRHHEFDKATPTITDLAHRYLQILAGAFPKGQKYIFCGFSFGGYLAWEMASILSNSDQVPIIFLFDTWSNHNSQDWSHAEKNTLVRSYKAGRQMEGCVPGTANSIALGCHRFRMGLHYIPSTLQGETKVEFFRPGKGPQMVDEKWWNGFCRENAKIDFHHLDTDRNSMLEEPVAEGVAQIMKQCITKFIRN